MKLSNVLNAFALKMVKVRITHKIVTLHHTILYSAYVMYCYITKSYLMEL